MGLLLLGSLADAAQAPLCEEQLPRQLWSCSGLGASCHFHYPEHGWILAFGTWGSPQGPAPAREHRSVSSPHLSSD